MRFVKKKFYDRLFFLMGLGVFAAFALMTVTGDNGILKLMSLRQDKLSLVKENREMMLENIALKKERTSLYEMKTVERLARESLGLVYPDEVVYMIQ